MDGGLGGQRREAVNTAIFLTGILFFETEEISADIYQMLHDKPPIRPPVSE